MYTAKGEITGHIKHGAVVFDDGNVKMLGPGTLTITPPKIFLPSRPNVQWDGTLDNRLACATDAIRNCLTPLGDLTYILNSAHRKKYLALLITIQEAVEMVENVAKGIQ